MSEALELKIDEKVLIAERDVDWVLAVQEKYVFKSYVLDKVGEADGRRSECGTSRRSSDLAVECRSFSRRSFENIAAGNQNGLAKSPLRGSRTELGW